MKILKKPQPKLQEVPKEDQKKVNQFIETKRRESASIKQEIDEAMSQYNIQRDALIQEIEDLGKQKERLLEPLGSIVEDTKQKQLQIDKELTKQKEITSQQNDILKKIQITKLNTEIEEQRLQEAKRNALTWEKEQKALLNLIKDENEKLKERKEKVELTIKQEIEKAKKIMAEAHEKNLISNLKEQALIRKEENLKIKEKLLKSRQQAWEALNKHHG